MACCTGTSALAGAGLLKHVKWKGVSEVEFVVRRLGVRRVIKL